MSPIPTPTEDLVRQLRAALEPELAVFDRAQKEYCTDHTLRRYLVARRSNVEKVPPFPSTARRGRPCQSQNTQFRVAGRLDPGASTIFSFSARLHHQPHKDANNWGLNPCEGPISCSVRAHAVTPTSAPPHATFLGS